MKYLLVINIIFILIKKINESKNYELIKSEVKIEFIKQ